MYFNHISDTGGYVVMAMPILEFLCIFMHFYALFNIKAIQLETDWPIFVYLERNLDHVSSVAFQPRWSRRTNTIFAMENNPELL